MKTHINNLGNEYNSFIYQWFDIKNKMYYIGSHVGHIDDGYKFGGIDIKKEYSIRPNDFERTIISYCYIKEYKEIRDIEREYLIKYDVENDDKYYNRTNESYGGYHKKAFDKRVLDIDENGLNSYQRAAIKMVETRKSKNNYNTAKIKEYETKNKNVEKYKISINKISNTLKGSRWVYKENDCKYIKAKEYFDYISNGWKDGRYYLLPYDECKKIAKDNNIKSEKEWRLLTKNIKNIPYKPDRSFKDIWISWYEFLDKKKNII